MDTHILRNVDVAVRVPQDVDLTVKIHVEDIATMLVSRIAQVVVRQHVLVHVKEQLSQV